MYDSLLFFEMFIISLPFDCFLQYELLDLKAVCERKCFRRMNVDNAAKFLKIADTHTAEFLKSKAMEYIKE